VIRNINKQIMWVKC